MEGNELRASAEELLALRALSEGLTDAIKARVAAENRADRGTVANKVLADSIKDIARATEDKYRELLRDEYERVVPKRVKDWAAGIPGLASGVLFPRLVGLVGNPRIATPYHWADSDGKRVLVADEPYIRGSNKAPNPMYGEDSQYHYGLRSFWRYCGCGDPADRPRSGSTQADVLRGGKRTTVRPVLYTFSSYLVRNAKRSPAIADSKYLAIYQRERAAAEAKRHEKQCQNSHRPPLGSNGCGTVAHPEWGAPGSPWRPGHCAAHAHRIVAKELLRDLYEVWPAPDEELVPAVSDEAKQHAAEFLERTAWSGVAS